MVTSIFSILINWLLLYGLLALGFLVYGKPLHGWRPEIAAALIATMGLGTLLLLGLTPIAEWLIRHSYDCDACTPEEAAYLRPLFATICRRAGSNPVQFRLYVCPKDEINALALGAKSIAVTTGLLQTATPEELEGVLAHELGHHLLNHTFWLTLTCVSGQVGNWALRLYDILLKTFGHLRFIPVLGYLVVALTWLLRLLFLLFDRLCSCRSIWAGCSARDATNTPPTASPPRSAAATGCAVFWNGCWHRGKREPVFSSVEAHSSAGGQTNPPPGPSGSIRRRKPEHLCCRLFSIPFYAAFRTNASGGSCTIPIRSRNSKTGSYQLSCARRNEECPSSPEGGSDTKSTSAPPA
jgi:heat shock protein HtpX